MDQIKNRGMNTIQANLDGNFGFLPKNSVVHSILLL
jgi:hypothetical protein